MLAATGCAVAGGKPDDALGCVVIPASFSRSAMRPYTAARCAAGKETSCCFCCAAGPGARWVDAPAVPVFCCVAGAAGCVDGGEGRLGPPAPAGAGCDVPEAGPPLPGSACSIAEEDVSDVDVPAVAVVLAAAWAACALLAARVLVFAPLPAVAGWGSPVAMLRSEGSLAEGVDMMFKFVAVE